MNSAILALIIVSAATSVACDKDKKSTGTGERPSSSKGPAEVGPISEDIVFQGEKLDGRIELKKTSMAQVGDVCTLGIVVVNATKENFSTLGFSVSAFDGEGNPLSTGMAMIQSLFSGKRAASTVLLDATCSKISQWSARIDMAD